MGSDSIVARLGELSTVLLGCRVGRSATFDADLSFGEGWEDTWLAAMVGRIEIKCDRLALKTGNLYVEYAYKGRPSGISKTTADWWVFGLAEQDGQVVRSLMVTTEWLKHAVKGCRAVKGGDNLDSMGYLLPMARVIGPKY